MWRTWLDSRIALPNSLSSAALHNSSNVGWSGEQAQYPLIGTLGAKFAMYDCLCCRCAVRGEWLVLVVVRRGRVPAAGRRRRLHSTEARRTLARLLFQASTHGRASAQRPPGECRQKRHLNVHSSYTSVAVQQRTNDSSNIIRIFHRPGQKQ